MNTELGEKSSIHVCSTSKVTHQTERPQMEKMETKYKNQMHSASWLRYEPGTSQIKGTCVTT
jgi:hypothetical protein